MRRAEKPMPPKRRKRAGSTVRKRIALNKRIEALQKEINRLKRARAGVNRDEFVEVVSSLRQLQRNTDDITKHTAELGTQLMRMSQIQAQIDEIQRALKKARLLN
jgi:chaperonin cofactor prefoldin